MNEVVLPTEKTLHNSDISGAHKNVVDIKVVGNGDAFRLICKASSQDEGWMKSTKAMEINGIGCLAGHDAAKKLGWLLRRRGGADPRSRRSDH